MLSENQLKCGHRGKKARAGMAIGVGKGRRVKESITEWLGAPTDTDNLSQTN